MPRTLSILCVVCFAAASAPAAASANSNHRRKITDRRYSISFYLPSTWRTPAITTSTSSATKLIIVDKLSSTAAGDVIIEVLPGSKSRVSAALVAAEVIIIYPKATILGSSVVSYARGHAEEVRYTIPEANNVTLFADADAFVLHHRSYLVSFGSDDPQVTAQVRASVLRSWGR